MILALFTWDLGGIEGWVSLSNHKIEWTPNDLARTAAPRLLGLYSYNIPDLITENK